MFLVIATDFNLPANNRDMFFGPFPSEQEAADWVMGAHRDDNAMGEYLTIYRVARLANPDTGD